MTCGPIRDLFELYRDGVLDAAEAAAVRTHLDGCDGCREFESECAGILAPLTGLPPGPYLPPLPPRLPPWATGASGLAILLGLLIAGGLATRFAGPGEGRETAVVRPLPPRPGRGDAPPEAARATPEPLPFPCSLAGRIVTPSGEGIGGARVRIGDAAATTDAAGGFLFEGLAPSGALVARIEAPGAPPFDLLVPELLAGVATVLESVEAGPPADLAVRVVDRGGRPVAGATVEAFRVAGTIAPDLTPYYPSGDASFARAAATGPDGRARIEALARGAWTLRARAPGMAPGRPGRADLGAGADPGEREIVLEEGAPFEGRVLDAVTREPVPGAEVAWARLLDLGRPNDALRARPARADTSGRFRFDDLPSAFVGIAARRPGSRAWTGLLCLEGGGVRRGDVPLAREGCLRGRVVEAGSGKPVAGALLDVLAPIIGRRGGVVSNPVRVATDAGGEFRCEGIPLLGGERVIVVPGQPRAVRGAPRPPSMSRLRTDGLGAAEREVTVFVEPVASLEGILRDPEGRGVAGALVTGAELAPSPFGGGILAMRHAFAVTDARGSFALRGVGPGVALLHASPPGTDPRDPAIYAALAAAAAGQREPDAAATVVLGRVTSVDAVLRASRRSLRPWAAALEGRVEGPDDHPVPGARLSVAEGSAGLPPVLEQNPMLRGALLFDPVALAEDGAFRARLEPRLTGADDAAAGRTFLLRAVAPGHRAATVAVTVKPGEPATTVRIRMEAGLALRGRVVDGAGSPVPGVPLELSATGGVALPTAATDAEGRFLLDGLPPGRKDLAAGWWHDPMQESCAVDIGTGDVEIRLAPTRSVEVRLAGPSGPPDGGLPVTWEAAGGGARGAPASADAAGIALLRGVPAKPIRITVGAPSEALGDPGAFLQATIPVEDPAATLVTVPLEPAASIAGVVEGPGGLPVERAEVTARVSDASPFFRLARTGADGTFLLRGLAPGERELRASWVGFEGSLRASAGATGVRIRLGAAAPPGTTGFLAAIAGTLRDTAGRPIAGATVALRPRGASTWAAAGTHTLPDGGFSLAAAKGAAYALVLRAPDGRALYVEEAVGGGAPLDLVLGAGGEGLRGRVRRPDGSAAAAVPVLAVCIDGGIADPLDLGAAGIQWCDTRGPGPARFRRTTTDGEGAFDLGNPAGAWAVFAGQPGTEHPCGPPALRPDGDRSPLDLFLGEGWTLRVPAAARPAGRVLEVRLEGHLPAATPAPFLRSARGAAGNLEFPGLPEGRVSVRWMDGYGGNPSEPVAVEPPLPGERVRELAPPR